MTKILISILIFGASLGVFFGLTMPLIETVKTDSAKAAKMATAISKFQDLEKKRNDLMAKRGSISNQDIDKLNASLPEQISAIRLITQIDDMTKDSGLILRTIDVEEPKSGSGKELTQTGEVKKYKSAAIVFSVAGSYKVFLGFLANLERSLQIIDIKDITFSVGSKADSYDFSVRALTYYAGD